jgi:hypothetical protein
LNHSSSSFFGGLRLSHVAVIRPKAKPTKSVTKKQHGPGHRDRDKKQLRFHGLCILQGDYDS